MGKTVSVPIEQETLEEIASQLDAAGIYLPDLTGNDAPVLQESLEEAMRRIAELQTSSSGLTRNDAQSGDPRNDGSEVEPSPRGRDHPTNRGSKRASNSRSSRSSLSNSSTSRSAAQKKKAAPARARDSRGRFVSLNPSRAQQRKSRAASNKKSKSGRGTRSLVTPAMSLSAHGFSPILPLTPRGSSSQRKKRTRQLRDSLGRIRIVSWNPDRAQANTRAASNTKSKNARIEAQPKVSTPLESGRPRKSNTSTRSESEAEGTDPIEEDPSFTESPPAPSKPTKPRAGRSKSAKDRARSSGRANRR